MSLEITQEQKDQVFLASGETHPELSRLIAENMGMELGRVALRAHPNTEKYVRYEESVRGKHVIVMQPHAPANGLSVDDAINQQKLMINAAKLASADEITAVSTVIAGARQDRKARGREPISIAMYLHEMQAAGANRVVAVDLHSPQAQGFFDGPFDHLTAQPMLRSYLAGKMTSDLEQYVVVSPDAGHAKTSVFHADKMGNLEVIHMVKTRDPDDPTRVLRQADVPEVDGRIVYMFDDMIDTAGTVQAQAEVLHNSGAKEIYIASTHPYFSYPAIERLQDAPIDEIVVTDTLPLRPEVEEKLGSRLKILSMAPMIAAALTEIITDGSVSEIFDEENFR